MDKFWRQALVGLAISVAGFVLYHFEKKRERPRTWVQVVAFAVMLVGAVYGSGAGEVFLLDASLNAISRA